MIIDELFESPQQCPECGGISFSDLILAEKKDACYHKVKASAKVWPSAYASGRLVQCRKKGAANYGNKSESVAEGESNAMVNIASRLANKDDGKVAKLRAAGDNRREDQLKGRDIAKRDRTSKDAWGYLKQGVAEDNLNELDMFAPVTTYVRLADGTYVAANWRRNQNLSTASNSASFIDIKPLAPAAAKQLGLDQRLNDPEKKYTGAATIASGGPIQASGPLADKTINVVDIRDPKAAKDSGVPDTLFGKIAQWAQQQGQKQPGVAEEYELAGVDVAYDLGRRAYRERKTIRDNPYSATKEARKYDEWEKGLERGKHDANDARLFRSSVGENAGQPLSVQQLATISDTALDQAYGYGRSTPGNTFGWQANLKSAAYAKQMIDQGVTDIEAISDAIHKGWNTTAQAFVQNPKQFDDTAKLAAAGKLEAKLQQRAQLMKQNYGQLPEEEKEKDRVVARALLQAIRGEQGVAEGEQQPGADYRDPPEAKYDDQYDAMVARVKKLAGLGPMRTVYDPTKRQYRNMPTAQQPKK